MRPNYPFRAPRLEYRSYGKSSLVLTPFTSAIPETIEVAISKLPAALRYTGLSKEEKKKIPSAIGCLRLVLKARWDVVRANKVILDPYSDYYDPWSQSTVWYHLREEYLGSIIESYIAGFGIIMAKFIIVAN